MKQQQQLEFSLFTDRNNFCCQKLTCAMKDINKEMVIKLQGKAVHTCVCMPLKYTSNDNL